jgi:hypothetical protein
MTPIPPLPPSVVVELQRLCRTELSRGARLGHVVLALLASAMSIAIVSLWLTEPVLPLRTQIAFAVLAAIGGGWAAFSVWVLRSRRVMLTRHRQVAGRLAVAFCCAFTLGCVLLAVAADNNAARPALPMSIGLLTVAIVLWRRAETAHSRLLAKRELLQRQLDGTSARRLGRHDASDRRDDE